LTIRISVLTAALLSVALSSGPATATEEWRILALRVDFPLEEPDQSSTTGTGKFDLRTHAEALVDYALPFDTPPHDRTYFQRHLEALGRYYDTVSEGRVQIQSAVFPREARRVYTLPRPMLRYANGRTEEEIGQHWISLLRDAISLAEADPDGPRFGDYNSFLVFHAGVGHETGQLNDIRSVFLTAADIDRYAGTGLQADGGTLEIRTAWILPETPSFTGRAGLNGLLAKFFGNQLGLPGLSNFADGLPAVGAWSLMDVGANRFGFLRRTRPDKSDTLAAGVSFVAPHPFAWSKVQLGWVAPLLVQRDTTVSLLATDRRGQLPKAVRIPLDPRQYLLLENRQQRGHRGPPPGAATPYANADDLVWIDNHQVDFSRPDSSGIWLGVEEYDAFVPGSGVLVWRVDDSVVGPNLATGAINNDPARAGIALIEADGYRDIGHAVFERLDQIEGSVDDPYYVGGQTRLGPDTWPDTRTYEGWDSGVDIQVLDTPGDVMRVRITFPRQLAGWPCGVRDGRRLRALDLDGNGATELISESAEGVRVVAGTGQLRLALEGAHLLAAVASAGQPGTLLIYRNEQVEAWQLDAAAPLWRYALALPPQAVAVASLSAYPGRLTVAMALARASTGTGELLLVDVADGAVLDAVDGMGTTLAVLGVAGGAMVLSDGASVVTPAGRRGVWDLPAVERLAPAAADLDGDGQDELVVASADGRVWLLAWETAPRLLTALGDTLIASPVVGDVDGDGQLEIVLTGRTRVHVLRADGITQAGFPLRAPDYAELGPLAHAPILVDLDADGRQEIVLSTARGLFAWDDSGEPLGGFPLLTAAPVVDAPVAADLDGDGRLELAAVTDAAVYAWTPIALSSAYVGTQAGWSQAGADAAGTRSHRRVSGPAAPDPAIGLLAPGRAYCYPNPVGADGVAHIRFVLNRPASVRLSIFDAVGGRIQELASGGELAGPGEHELSWSVRDYASGLYLCRLQALGADGGSQETLVKMAVSR
jgi:M6 family metalloprotease-like protein